MDRLTRFDDVVPTAGVLAGALIIATMIAGAAWLALRRVTMTGLLFGCACVQAWPVVVGWDVAFVHYGVFASWFAVMALARGGALMAASKGPEPSVASARVS